MDDHRAVETLLHTDAAHLDDGGFDGVAALLAETVVATEDGPPPACGHRAMRVMHEHRPEPAEDQ